MGGPLCGARLWCQGTVVGTIRKNIFLSNSVSWRRGASPSWSLGRESGIDASPASCIFMDAYGSLPTLWFRLTLSSR